MGWEAQDAMKSPQSVLQEVPRQMDPEWQTKRLVSLSPEDAGKEVTNYNIRVHCSVAPCTFQVLSSGCYVGLCRYRTFPPTQKVILDSAALRCLQRLGNVFITCQYFSITCYFLSMWQKQIKII